MRELNILSGYKKGEDFRYIRIQYIPIYILDDKHIFVPNSISR